MSAFESDLKKPIDEQVQSALHFVQQHEKTLASIDVLTRNSIFQKLSSTEISNGSATHYVKPIKIFTEPFERVLPQDLLSSEAHDNSHPSPIQKALTVLVFICDEVCQLSEIAESRFYKPLLMFGVKPPPVPDSDDGNGNSNGSDAEEDYMTPGHREKLMGKFLPFLQELSNFIDRCYSVTLNLVQQVASLYSSKEPLYRTSFKQCNILQIYLSLGELLGVMIAVDALIQQNEILLDCWAAYKSMILFMRVDPVAFNIDEKGIDLFERLLVGIDQSLMLGYIFKGCIEQNFELTMEECQNDNTHTVRVRDSEEFLSGSFRVSLKAIIEVNSLNIGTTAEGNEKIQLGRVVGLYALYRRLIQSNTQPDEKLYRAVWGLQKLVPVVLVCGNVMWLVGEFISEHAYLEVKNSRTLDPPAADTYRRAFVQQFDSQLAQKSNLLVAQCKAWMILAETRLQPDLPGMNPLSSAQVHDQLLEAYGSILLRGLSLLKRCCYIVQVSLNMHSCMQMPVTRTNLLETAVVLETLKALQFTFLRKHQVIAELLVHASRALSVQILSFTDRMRLKLESSNRRTNGSEFNLHFAICCLERILRSSDSLSASRRVAISLLAQVFLSSPVCAEKERVKVQARLDRLLALHTLSREIQTAADTSHLLFHLDVLPVVMNTIYSLPTQCNRLQYLFAAYEDGLQLCQMVLHTSVAPFFLNLRATLRHMLQKQVIEPLCREVETDLRLHIHTKHLDHLQAPNPKTENFRPLRQLLDVAPIRILGTIVDIKAEVTHYLDMNFYNLTTVALHDWRTYSDMRSLAAEKLGLVLMDNFLPMGSLDQGLDVLQIMRNIHVFVGRFTYNMNMQQFVEYRPDKASKHLNTIRIQSIAASIRQHGLGVLNTTVNFTYQFLSSKFNVFSQFLFDDYIKAYLSREHRWFKKHKNEPEINNRYPYDRALEFVREIRKLGVNEAGKSFLDQFRILITEIGNGLGYVRMVRSASMYYCSETVKFLPEFDDIIQFEEHAGSGTDKAEREGEECETKVDGANLSSETVRAAKNLDEIISTMVKNFGEGNDYFKVLVNVFQSVLLTDEHAHLKYFYLIVPALCISWTDAALAAKNAMHKTSRGVTKEMYFTDDGFAVGVAYCLAILKQSRRNESLHWVETINLKIKGDARELKEQQNKRMAKEAAMREREKSKKKGSGFFGSLISGKKNSTAENDDDFDDYEDHEEVHTLQLTAKKLEAYRRESEQLFYSMSGAEIFFKRTDIDTS